MRRYSYVGPDDIRRRVAGSARGAEMRSVANLASLLRGDPMTFVVDAEGTLRVADRRSEHVACAGGGDVLAPGELTAVRDGATVRVTDISNQSTGYCPEPASWTAVARALDDAGIAHPGGFTCEVTFRRCPKCGERNLVKDDWFECALCSEELPRAWNFQ